jgi:GGDEF domain-containing protein
MATEEPFLDKVGIELKRAERYRIFISLIVIDLGFVSGYQDGRSEAIITELMEVVSRNIRAIDNVSRLDDNRLALLFPETTRQGAEIASKRVTDLIRTHLTAQGHRVDQVIPLEMASYPDAAGARSVADFLREFSNKNVN